MLAVPWADGSYRMCSLIECVLLYAGPGMLAVPWADGERSWWHPSTADPSGYWGAAGKAGHIRQDI